MIVPLVFASFRTLAAQADPSVLAVGARVRLTVPCATETEGKACRVQGRLVRIAGDTIALTADGRPTQHPLDVISRFEVARGRRSYWLVGAGAGLLVGAGTTWAVLNAGGSTALCDRSANQDALSAGECLALFAGGGLVGAGLGALVGGLIRTERWEPIDLARVRIGFWQTPGKPLAAAVRVVF